MKKLLAITSVLICCMGNEYPAKASISEANRLIKEGNSYSRRAIEFASSGDRSTGCRWFKKAGDNYASAFAIFPAPSILNLLEKHNSTYEKHC